MTVVHFAEIVHIISRLKLLMQLCGEDEIIFLLYDNYNPNDNQDRMLIFSTEKNLQILNENRNWLCDGTFDAAPAIFKQLFTVHVIKNGKKLPLVYALLTNKLETYIKVFQVSKSKIQNDPLSVTSDFEISIINSVYEVFPDAEVDGCFFHLKKSIWRHVQDSELVSQYNDSEKEENYVRRNVKMLA